MKKTVYFMIMAMIAIAACSCSTTKSSTEANLAQAAADSAAHARAAQLLTSRSFLIKAKTIRIGYMGTKEVIPEHNFIMMNDGRVTINISPFFTGGANGTGGTSGSAIVTGYKERISKKGELFITFRLDLGGKVTITLPPKSARAMVNFEGETTLYGEPQPYDPTLVIEGMSRR